jgi:hypothetical protein
MNKESQVQQRIYLKAILDSNQWTCGRTASKFNITITILDIIHCPVLYLKISRFGAWILSPSSGGTYSGGPNR